MTIRTLLDRAAAARPARLALRYRRSGAWLGRTYAELAEGVRRLAGGFGGLGLVPGQERVALLLENGPEWVESFLALAGTGLQVVPLDPKLKAEEVRYIVSDSQAALIVSDARHLPLLERILSELPAVRAVVLTEHGPGAPAAVAGRPCQAYEALRAAAAGAAQTWYEQHRPAPQDVASIIYTSGTTGKAKGAMLTHNNFCSDVAGALDTIGKDTVTAADDFLIVLPLFHSFSFTANLVLPLYCGAGMFFAESLRTLEDDLRSLRPTILMAVPLLAEKLLCRLDDRLGRSRTARLLFKAGLGGLVARRVRKGLGGRLRFLVVGGAPCPLHVFRRFKRLGVTLVEGYGLTECSPIVTINSFRAPRFGSIGRKIANIELRIAEANEQGVGELQVRGPVVMKGYFRNLEATREAFDGEWFRTGDLVSQAADGLLTIRGRKKALIVNREGKNIYPEEVEAVIARDPAVGDVLVLGYQAGGDPGERVGAILTPNLEAIRQARGGEEPAWEQVEHLLREAVHRQCESLSDYKHPRKLAFRREPLERTSLQKVRRCVYQGSLNE